MEDFFKIAPPLAVLLLWLRFALSKADAPTKVATLYLMSVGVFSFNFAFYFREIHQSIHAFVALLGLVTLIRKGFPKFNFALLIFASMIAISVTSASAWNDRDARSHLINFTLIFFVVNFFRGYCWNEQSMLACLRFLAGAGTIIASFGLIEWVFLTEGRIEGPMSNPNYFGFYLGVTYIAAFYALQKWTRIGAMAAMLIAILLCGSRAAFLFPIAHAAFYFLHSKEVLRRFVMMLGVLAVAMALVMTGVSRFSATEAVSSSDSERLAFLHIALDMAADHPLTGVGWGMFPAEFWSYASASDAVIFSMDQEVDVSREERRVTHNDLLRVLAELGYIAGAFASVIVIWGLWKCMRGNLPMAGAIAPLWLGNITFAMTHNNMNSALFWILFLLPFFGVLNQAPARPRKSMVASPVRAGAQGVSSKAGRGLRLR